MTRCAKCPAVERCSECESWDCLVGRCEFGAPARDLFRMAVESQIVEVAR